MKFLLVDESPPDRELTVRTLQRAYLDAEFLEVARQAEFSAAVASRDFDIVLTEYVLSWTNGLAVLRAVKEACPAVPVIMLTGSIVVDDHVAERVRAEAALRESEERYRQMFEKNRAVKLLTATMALTLSLDLDTVLERVLDNLARLVPYDTASVLLMREDNTMAMRALRGYKDWTDVEQLRRMAFDLAATPTIFRVFNVVRHAQATHADVLLESREQGVLLIIEDNGIGFDYDEAVQRGCLGLFGMRERPHGGREFSWDRDNGVCGGTKWPLRYSLPTIMVYCGPDCARC